MMHLEHASFDKLKCQRKTVCFQNESGDSKKVVIGRRILMDILYAQQFFANFSVC